MPKPNFFIVGAPKCGTTAMTMYLQKHPEIYIPNHKELHYFGSDLQYYLPRLKYSLKTYLSFFEEATDEKIIGEASVMYLSSQRAAQEIKEFSPPARILIMLRNPVDMMYSFHSQLLFTADEDIHDFKEALAAEELRRKGKAIPPKNTMLNYLFYRYNTQFTQHVKRYFDIFGQENVHVIIYDDFKEDVALTYKETLCFLQIDPDFKPDFQIINPNKRARSLSLQHFLKSPPKTLAIPFKLLLPLKFRIRLVKKVRMLNAIYDSRSPLEPDFEHRLKRELLPEVEKLSELLERDLTHWCKLD